MKCNQCGTEFEGKFCTKCGAQAVAYATVPTAQPIPQPPLTANLSMRKAKKPFYKKGWLFAVAIIAVIMVSGCIVGCNKGGKIEWSKIKLAAVLPEPKSNNGKINENTDEKLWLELYKTSEDQYNDYISLCKGKGFTVDSDTTSISYQAYNSDGYSLDLSWYGNTMTIQLETPMQFATIQWPSSTAGKLLPAPKSTTGKFSYEHDDSFLVYIGNTTKADFGEYITACSDKGFKVDFDKGDRYYYADNSKGYHVSVKYEGNNIMSVGIDAPDDSKDTSSAVSNVSSKTEPSSNDTKSAISSDKKDNTAGGVSTEFKAAMDSYEKFFNEYVAFMKKYKESNGTDMSILTDYANYMSKYAETMDKFEKWEDKDLNTAEMAYYIEVQTRISKKLLEATQ